MSISFLKIFSLAKMHYLINKLDIRLLVDACIIHQLHGCTDVPKRNFAGTFLVYIATFFIR